MPGMAVPRFGTFTDLLRARAAAHPGRDAHVFLGDAGPADVPERLGYGRLDREARRIAAHVQSVGAAGEPILLLYTSTTAFLTAFAGCLYAGAVAVPAPMPGPATGDRCLHRTTSVLADTGARLVLTDSRGAPEVSQWLARAGRPDVACLATDLPGPGDPDAWREPGTTPDDLAFLQYTSGSVAEPRGVMVTHRNLMANQAALCEALDTTADDRFGSWLPYYHDMGLIAHLLHPLWLGGSSVQLNPDAFARHPLRWLRAIDDHGVTVAGGPNFCYDLCVRRVTAEQAAALDLSRWRLALNGAEPVRHESLDAFTRHFAPAGLAPEAPRPCYGLAEATLVVTAGAPGTPYVRRTVDAGALEHDRLTDPAPGGASRTLVGSGRPAGAEVRVVDPLTRRELPDGTVGEIWLNGPSVARGYWKQPTETTRVFRATPRDGDGHWLRTGDLGALQDGELLVTGRLKEVVIVNGRNLHPQDVEYAARGVTPAPRLGPGAAFGVEAAGHERLVLVQELRTSGAGPDTLRRLARDLQDLIARRFDVPAGGVLLVAPGTVRRTTSGKIRRTLTRRLFLEGTLRGEYEVLTPQVRDLVRAADTLLGEDLLSEPAGAW